MEIFRVLQAGAFTTIQDMGRYGYQQFGIPVSGALDKFSFQVANRLVGNPDSAAVLECAYLGPKLEVLSECIISVTGADAPLLVNGEAHEMWRSFILNPGEVVSFRPAQRGVRSYLAVSGGIDVPEVIGSRSTFVGAKIGGLGGRSLNKGDILSAGRFGGAYVPRSLPHEFRPPLESRIRLRAIPGPQDDYFDEGFQIFFKEEFEVTSEADRMGYRLAGPQISIKEGVLKTIISEPSVPGSVQVPPDGRPIIELVELTVGGYAKIATVITSDLDLVAQARPGDLIRFTSVNLAEAHKIFFEYQRKLNHALKKAYT